MEDASRRLSPSGFMQLCEENDVRRFSQEQIVFREGDASDGLYFVLSGRLKVYSATGNGRELVYDVVGPGELLGELSLDGGPLISAIRLEKRAVVPGLEADRFRAIAEDAKRNCPVSKALAAVPIALEAVLEG